MGLSGSLRRYNTSQRSQLIIQNLCISQKVSDHGLTNLSLIRRLQSLCVGFFEKPRVCLVALLVDRTKANSWRWELILRQLLVLSAVVRERGFRVV